MVANPSNMAIVLPFRSRVGGFVALLRELLRLNPGGTWTGGQPELAHNLDTNVRTIGRWVAAARRAGYLTTTGKTEILTYEVLAVPGASDISTEAMSEASDTDVHVKVRSFGHSAPVQIQPSRAPGSSSSSSSSSFGHDASDIPTPEMSEGSGSDDDGGMGSDPPILTARGELHFLYHVEPTAQMADEWQQLDTEGRRFVSRKCVRFPSVKDRTNPPPPLVESWVHSALQDQQARHAIERADPAALDALLEQATVEDTVDRHEPPAAQLPREERDALAAALNAPFVAALKSRGGGVR